MVDSKQPMRFASGTQELDPIAIANDGISGDDIVQIVHDLKTPLTAIALEVEMMQDQFAHLEPGLARVAAARITRNVAFLDRMVRDLLDLAALGSSALALVLEPTELRSLIEDVIERIVSPADRTRVFLEADGPLTLVIDAARIERVISNLLANALKFAPKATGIVVRLDREASAASISVIDSGPGLTSAQMAYIFDKYRRVDHRLEGSGLGLYISKRIVEAHGGHIGVERVRGVGSRFFFDLPVTS